MANPLNQLNPINQPSNNLKDLYQIFVNSQNPIQMFSNMARQNPQLQPIIQALQNGEKPEQIFNNLCQQRGIDPQEFLKNLSR